MNVLMINTEKDRGGAARMAATLVNALNSTVEGVTASLIHCGDDQKADHFIGIKRPHAYYANVLQTRLFGTHHVYDFGVTDEILRHAEKADVIHLHNLHGYYLDYVRLIECIKNKPVIWTWHDMWGATGRCGFSMDCDAWKTGCQSCLYLNYYPKAWLDHAAAEFRLKSELFLNMSNLFIVSPSEWLRQIAIERGYSPEKTSAIPNPVDLSKYKPVNRSDARSKLGLPDEPLALFVAHNCNDERKRYCDFEQVVKRAGIRGVVAGVPPERQDPDLIYLGKLNNSDDLALSYSACDVFVITSQTDNYPNTVIESMACGTPVFGYAIGGIPSQMPPGWDGLVEFGDKEGLLKKVQAYLESYNDKVNLRAELSEYATKSWNPINIANQYIEIYRKVSRK